MWRNLFMLMQKERSGGPSEAARILLICASALVSALNIKSFVHSGDLFPGGFTGLTILIQRIFLSFLGVEIPYSPVVILLNLVPAVITFIYVGKRFTLYSCLMFALSGVLVDILPSFEITDDVLLSAVFGGILNAVAEYLCLSAGATSGGTDFIAILISEKFGRDAWNYMFAFNAAVLSVAGFLFGWPRALYSILFQFASTQLVNSIYRRYQKATLFIVTDKAQEVYEAIRQETNHSATLFTGKGCHTGEERDILYSIVSADQVRRVVKRIREIDPRVFINIVRSQQLVGHFYMRPND